MLEKCNAEQGCDIVEEIEVENAPCTTDYYGSFSGVLDHVTIAPTRPRASDQSRNAVAFNSSPPTSCSTKQCGFLTVLKHNYDTTRKMFSRGSRFPATKGAEPLYSTPNMLD